MSNKSHRNTLIALGIVLVGLGLLIGPAANWLQVQESDLPLGQRPDAIYLVAGAHAQKQRVAGAVACLRSLQREGLAMPPVLIGNDTEPCGWSKKLQRNPCRWEVSANWLRAAVPGCDAKVIAGEIKNTDTEMAVLAGYLAIHPEIRCLAVVTSPSHERRALSRLRAHLKLPVDVSLVQVTASWRDRAPWFVAMELVKLTRDRVGLASSPWFTRTYVSADIRWLNVVLYVALGLLIYAWLVYPLLLGAVGRQRSEVRGQKSEVGGQRTEVGTQTTDYRGRTTLRRCSGQADDPSTLLRAGRGQTTEEETKISNIQHSISKSQVNVQCPSRNKSEVHDPATRILNPESDSASHSDTPSLRYSDTPQPAISILVAAHQEESLIGRRIGNLDAAIQRYKASRSGTVAVRVFLGVDGCGDRTAERAREAANGAPWLTVCEFKERRGKVAVLKELVKATQTSIQYPISNNELNIQHSTLNTQRSSEEESGAHHLESCIIHPASGTPSTPILRHSDTPIPLLVFTDANTMFHPDALEKLLSHFDDPGVGGVCGKLVFVEREQRAKRQGASGEKQSEISNNQHSISKSQVDAQLTTDNGQLASSDTEHRTLLRQGYAGQALNTEHSTLAPEGAYWGLETWLKERESSLDSCLGANGAIYAIRSELFWAEIPDNTIVDDFVIGMKVREKGYRMVYEPTAVAEEELPEAGDEWMRRVRIGAGDFQALGLCSRCLSPRYGRFAWMFWSHKVLRWFTPHLLMIAFVAASLAVVMDMADSNALWSPDVTVPWLTLAGMGGFLMLAWVGRGRLGRACAYFVAMQAALFAGFLRFCKGNLRGSWDRTPR